MIHIYIWILLFLFFIIIIILKIVAHVEIICSALYDHCV